MTSMIAAALAALAVHRSQEAEPADDPIRKMESAVDALDRDRKSLLMDILREADITRLDDAAMILD